MDWAASTSCQCNGPRPCLKTQTAGLCRLCFVSTGDCGGRGGGRDLFTWRYTGYGRSQVVVTPSFLRAIKAIFKRKQGRSTKKKKRTESPKKKTVRQCKIYA